MLKVIKRDGRVKDYDYKRIEIAVNKAYRDVYTDEAMYQTTCKEFYEIMHSIRISFDESRVDYVNIEDIQERVINIIKRYNVFVADSYSDYRNKRSLVRDANSSMMKDISGILNSTNLDIMNENSNKQAQLASTQRDLIAGEVSKAIARTIIPKHLMDAHDVGLLKIHDLDYFMQGIYNCELVNLEDMLQNGTVISKKLIEKPKSLRTAMTIATQIIAQVASSTYGGQTISLSHLAPFVRDSENRIYKKYSDMKLDIKQEELHRLIRLEHRAEIRDAVQTCNYQVSTIMTTNGQTPFISICMYISENPEYEKETALLIEEFLIQRLNGMKNEYGIAATQTFPKLLYFLDDNNIEEGSEYYWLTQLSAKCTVKRMNPDYISVKKMKEVMGAAFPPMGCRAFLSMFKDKDGKDIFYGRGNLGAQSINLPFVALESKRDMTLFWKGLDDALELARQMSEIRYEKLRGIKAESAPILWQHGAISRLKPDEEVLKAVDERGFTVAIGYSGIYETVKYLIGESHTSYKGFALAEKIMKYMRDKCLEFREAQPHLRFALYGTPSEASTGWFNDKLIKRFGIIKDITDKGWITNSYHVDIRENIDAFAKLALESKLQQYSTGGAVSYIETCNMSKNVPAVLHVMKYIYNTIVYAELNFEADACGKCRFEGVMNNDPKTLKWVCPQCGNDDQKTLSVIRRTCGYLGETDWTDGRKLDILNRVKHL